MTKNLGLTAAQISASLREAKGDCSEFGRDDIAVRACKVGVDYVEKNMRDRSPFLSGITITNVGIAADRARADCLKQGRHLACTRAVGVVEASLKTLQPITRDLVRQSIRGATALCSGRDAADCRRGVRLTLARLKEIKPGLDGNRMRA